jgi:hypothetical protein
MERETNSKTEAKKNEWFFGYQAMLFNYAVQAFSDFLCW